MYSYFLDTLHVHFSIVGVNKFHKKLYFTEEEGCPFNLNDPSSNYVSQVKSYNFFNIKVENFRDFFFSDFFFAKMCSLF